MTIQLLDPEFQHDPFEELARCRREQPVFQAADLPAFVLTKYEDVVTIRDESTYSTRLIKMIREPIDGPSMIQMDCDEHKRNRSLVATAFRPKVLNQFVTSTVAPLVHSLIDEFADKGEVELMRNFCERLPFYSIAELLGIEVDDQPRLSRLYKDQIAADPLQSGPEEMARSMAAREGLTELLRPVVERCLREPDDSFISQIVNATTPDGDRLSEEEVYGFLRFLLPAGEDTTMTALGTLVLELLCHPDQRELLQQHPELLNKAIEEGLRWRAPIAYLNRVTDVDVDYRDVTIPAGSLVLGSVNSANRDEAVFEEPDRFDITREPNRHIAFGVGVHMCIGAALARSSLRLALPALFERLPNLRLAPGTEPRYAGLFSNAVQELHVQWG